MTGYIGETEIAALASEDELAVIDPEEMENGGVEVVGVHGIPDGVIAEFVGGSVGETGLGASRSCP